MSPENEKNFGFILDCIKWAIKIWLYGTIIIGIAFFSIGFNERQNQARKTQWEHENYTSPNWNKVYFQIYGECYKTNFNLEPTLRMAFCRDYSTNKSHEIMNSNRILSGHSRG